MELRFVPMRIRDLKTHWMLVVKTLAVYQRNPSSIPPIAA